MVNGHDAIEVRVASRVGSYRIPALGTRSLPMQAPGGSPARSRSSPQSRSARHPVLDGSCVPRPPDAARADVVRRPRWRSAVPAQALFLLGSQAAAGVVGEQTMREKAGKC